MRAATMWFRSAVVLMGILVAPLASAQPATACGQMSAISGAAAGAGATNGITGIFLPGDSVTIAATLGTATAATFRIVGEPAGVVTLAGPAAVPGTLSYTVTGPLLPPAIGIGYYIDTANGTVNITASCVNVPIQVPTTSNWALAVIALLLAGSTALYLRRRR